MNPEERPSGSREDIRLLHEMIRIRRLEEKSAELYTVGKIRGFLHLYVGQEAIAVGAMAAIRPETNQDNIVSTYRDHGHAMARGMTMKTIMAELYGKSTGCSRGRGGSMHLFDAGRHFYGGYGVVGGGIPISVGLALADRMQKRDAITICFLGDGATAEGVFHESLNIAALWKLPVLFLCENNYYAMGTRLELSHSQTRLATLAESHRIPSEQADGMDVRAVIQSTSRVADAVRETQTPRFIEFLTYRFRSHSMYDPDLYRTKQEIQEWKKRDPIQLLSSELMDRKELTERDFRALEREVDAEIAEAIQFAEASPWEPAEDLMKDVYTPPATERAGRHEPAA